MQMIEVKALTSQSGPQDSCINLFYKIMDDFFVETSASRSPYFCTVHSDAQFRLELTTFFCKTIISYIDWVVRQKSLFWLRTNVSLVIQKSNLVFLEKDKIRMKSAYRNEA